MYNKGIELLRIVAMYMILTTHIIGAGGIMKVAESQGGLRYAVISIIVVAFYCHVNCYALISGYVGLNSKFKLSKIVNIWIHIIFYSLGITLIAWTFTDSITTEVLFKSATPIYSGIYWYMTAYFILLLFTPLVNSTIKNMELKNLVVLVVVFLIFFSVVPTILGDFTTYIPLNEGFSFLWLFVLYLVGALLSRLDLKKMNKPILLFCLYLVSVVLTAILKIYIGDAWLTYSSPTIFICALCLFLIFVNLDLDKVNINLRLIGSLTLGVYLIHIQAYVYQHLLLEKFSFIGKYEFYIIPICVLFVSFIVYIFLLLIDYGRYKLFKIIKVNEKIDAFFEKLKI